MKRLTLILFLLLVALAARGQDLSLTLDDCLRGAMEADADLKGASLDVLAAKAQRQEALSLYFPTVSIQGMAFKAFDPLLELGIRDILREGEGAQRFYDAANFVASISWTGATRRCRRATARRPWPSSRCLPAGASSTATAWPCSGWKRPG